MYKWYTILSLCNMVYEELWRGMVYDIALGVWCTIVLGVENDAALMTLLCTILRQKRDSQN